MKVLNSVADRMLRMFAPSLSASAHSCPSGWWHGVQYRRCGRNGAGLQYRHYCCFSPTGCSYRTWSGCFY